MADSKRSALALMALPDIIGDWLYELREVMAMTPSETAALKETQMDEIPRRNRMDQWTDAEKAIQAAVDAVEAAGADVRLTDAVLLLVAARESVADFVDGVPWWKGHRDDR